MFKELNILRVFFENSSREFGVREIARLLKISPATASKELKELSRKGILIGRKDRIFLMYKANLDAEHYKDLKLFYNIRKIKESGLVDALNRFYAKPAILLFGSASSGEDTEDSDFDLLIVSEKTKDFTEKQKFEKNLNRKLQIFVVKKISDLKNEHLVNNVLNGLVLQGRIKWI